MAKRAKEKEEFDWDDDEPEAAGEAGTARTYVCDDCYYRWVEEEKSPDREEELYDEDGNLRFEDTPPEPACPVCPMCGSSSVSEC